MRGVGAYCSQDPSRLVAPHDTDASIGPHEQEVGAVGSPTHAIVAGTKAPTYQHCQFRHLPTTQETSSAFTIACFRFCCRSACVSP